MKAQISNLKSQILFSGFDDWIEIFRGGRQVDGDGREHDGDELIRRAVAGFNAAKHEPPAVIGHPQQDAPAYAWVEGLKTDTQNGVNVLMAKFKQIVPEFADMVKRGLFKKRSAAFYKNGTLRHVGFLGAAPPAVKGLADIGFSEEGVTFEFAAGDAKTAQETRAKKYGISVKDGGHVTKPGEWADVPDDGFLDPVNYRYPIPDADQTRAAAGYWGREKNQAQYSAEERAKITARLNKARKKFNIGQPNGKEGNKMTFKEVLEVFKFWKQVEAGGDLDDFTIRPQDNGKTFSESDIEKAKAEAAEAAKKEAEGKFAEMNKTASKRTEIASMIDMGITEGKILPAWKDGGIVAFMEGLDDKSAVEFAEGAKKSPYAWFKEFLDGLGKPEIFKALATKRNAEGNFAESEKDAALAKAIVSKVNPPQK